jgi:hypothetical protein
MKRLRVGEWLAAAGGIALIVSLFTTWYSPLRPLLTDEPLSGFEAFTVIDVLLALFALLGIALAVLQATQDSPTLPVAAGVLTASLGIVAVLLVVFRLIDAPRDMYELDLGAWLGLAATLAITAGGWLSMGNEHVNGLPPDIEPELRPAPAP